MACDIDIFDAVPVTPSAPDDDDVVIFLLPDRTVVGRTWSTIKATSVPTDVQILVTDGAHVDGELHSGEGTVVLPQFVGFRSRVFRNGQYQVTFAVPSTSYVLIDIATGTYNFTPVVFKNEIIIIQGY
jgi:hypothetical protein